MTLYHATFCWLSLYVYIYFSRADLIIIDTLILFSDGFELNLKMYFGFGVLSSLLVYVTQTLRRLSDMPSRRRLRSSLTHQLDVRQSQCATVGDRAFAAVGARLWNSLPADIVACDALPQFRRELKTFLFRQSYPSILLYFFSLWSLRFLLRPR